MQTRFTFSTILIGTILAACDPTTDRASVTSTTLSTISPEASPPPAAPPLMTTFRCGALDHAAAYVSRVEWDRVWVRLNYRGLVEGRFVVRFYPFGRYTLPEFTIDLGVLLPGADVVGEFGPYHIPNILVRTNLTYNIDLEIYDRNDRIVLQCDRGPGEGEPPYVEPEPPVTTTTTVPTPPPPPPPFSPCDLPQKWQLEGTFRVVPLPGTRFRALVTAVATFEAGPAFVGELQVFWRNGSSTFVKARTPVVLSCHDTLHVETLSWMSDDVGATHPHVNCTVEYAARLVAADGTIQPVWLPRTGEPCRPR